MTRPKAAQDKQQVGRKCAFSKRKEFLLAKFEPSFREQKARKERSAFYDKLGNWCIARWGYRKDHSVDLDDEDNDPDEIINIENSVLPEDDDLTEEEARFRTEYYNTLRTKLGQHFRRVVLHPPVKSGIPSLPTPLLATLVSAKVPKPPVKSTFINQYMMMHYSTLMKGEADRRVALAQFNYNALTPEERPGKEPCPLTIRKQVARDFWKTESTEVKESVLAAAGAAHEENLEEWAKLKEVPKTAAQYHHQIQYAGCTIRPILEALAAQMDAPMILLMPVPIPERSGDVEIVTVHVPKPGALVTNTWFAYDPAGYTASELSVLEWGRTQFTAEDRARRALAPDASGTNSATVATTPTITPTQSTPLNNVPVTPLNNVPVTPLNNVPVPVTTTPLNVPVTSCKEPTNLFDTPTPRFDIFVDDPTTPLNEAIYPVDVPTPPLSERILLDEPMTPLNEPVPPVDVPGPFVSVLPPPPIVAQPMDSALPPVLSPLAQPPYHLAPATLAIPLWPTGGHTVSNARTPTQSPFQQGQFTTPTRGSKSPPLPAAFMTAAPSPFQTPARSSGIATVSSHTLTATAAHPVTPICTSHLGFIDLPAHIQLLHDYFLTNPETGIARAWNGQWLITVREYISFEKRSGFPIDSTRLARPTAEVDWWRKSKRPLKDQPPRLRSADECVAEFWKWWTSLQPNERAYNAESFTNTRPSKEMDWGKLDKPGRNGIVLVMLQLTWWGNFSGNDAVWLRAVKDVSAVLRCLGTNSYEDNPPSSPIPSVKRKAPPLTSLVATNKKAKVAKVKAKAVPASTLSLKPCSKPRRSTRL